MVLCFIFKYNLKKKKKRKVLQNEERWAKRIWKQSGFSKLKVWWICQICKWDERITWLSVNGEQGIMWTGFNDRIHGCSLWQWDGKHETDSNFQQEFAACKIA